MFAGAFGDRVNAFSDNVCLDPGINPNADIRLVISSSNVMYYRIYLSINLIQAIVMFCVYVMSVPGDAYAVILLSGFLVSVNGNTLYVFVDARGILAIWE